MKLSIIIVSFQCKDKLRVTLDAVFASQNFSDYEVIVVDNGSTDGTSEMVRKEYENKIIFIQNTNEGFSKGNNRGIRVAGGEYLLLLNPDTKVAPDCLSVMMKFAESRPDIGIATCKLIRPDGSLDLACRRGLPNPWNSLVRQLHLSFLFPKSKVLTGYNLTHAPVDQDMAVGSCSGAFMLVSPKCLAAVGGLDEQFFMYGEDIDWCKRAGDAGFKVWYHAATTCVHYKGQSSKRAPKLALHAFYEAMWLYYKKHLATKYPAVLNWLVYLGIKFFYFSKLLTNLFKQSPVISK